MVSCLEVPKSDDTQQQTEEACKSDDDRFSIEFNALQVEVGKDIIWRVEEIVGQDDN